MLTVLISVVFRVGVKATFGDQVEHHVVAGVATADGGPDSLSLHIFEGLCDLLVSHQ